MNRAAFERRVSAGERILVDTSATELVDRFVKTGRNAAVLSPVTAMEILVKPRRLAPLKDRVKITELLDYR